MQQGLHTTKIYLKDCQSVMGLIAGAVEGEASGRQVRELRGLRGAQRVLQVGMVPVDQDLRRGRAIAGERKRKNVKSKERENLPQTFLRGLCDVGHGRGRRRSQSVRLQNLFLSSSTEGSKVMKFKMYLTSCLQGSSAPGAGRAGMNLRACCQL